MKRILLLLVICAALAQSQEVSKVGTTAAKFLSIPAGPRALAMGSAFVSVADDPSAMYWNPSGIARLQQTMVVFSHTNLFVDMDYNYAAAVLPLGSSGVVGFNITEYSSGQMDVNTEDFPDGTGERFSMTSYAFGLTYAKVLTDWFTIGANVKYVSEQIWHTSSGGMAVDIGTLFNTPFYGVRFGASISNFGSKMQLAGEDLSTQVDTDPTHNGNDPNTPASYKTGKYDLPLNLRIGISKDIVANEDQVLTVGVDAVHPNDNTENLNLGAEYQLFKRIVAIRGGYRSLFLKDSDERFTLGGGLNYTFDNLHVTFDYAYQSFNQLSGVHSFSVGLGF